MTMAQLAADKGHGHLGPWGTADTSCGALVVPGPWDRVGRVQSTHWSHNPVEPPVSDLVTKILFYPDPHPGVGDPPRSPQGVTGGRVPLVGRQLGPRGRGHGVGGRFLETAETV